MLKESEDGNQKGLMTHALHRSASDPTPPNMRMCMYHRCTVTYIRLRVSTSTVLYRTPQHVILYCSVLCEDMLKSNQIPYRKIQTLKRRESSGNIRLLGAHTNGGDAYNLEPGQ